MAARTFICDNSVMAQIQGQPNANAVVDIAGNTVFEICSTTQTPHTLVNATHHTTLIVQDYADQLAPGPGGTGVYYALVEQLDLGLPAGFDSILCDYEDWGQSSANGGIPQTSLIVAQNPIPYYQISGEKIANEGLIGIAAPARDLASVLIANPSGEDAGYEGLQIAALVSPSFPRYSIQAQNDQPPFPYTGTFATFQNFVSAVTGQITAAAPSCIMTCGLAVHTGDNADSANWTVTEPGGGWPANHLQWMINQCATYAVSKGCAGFWLNFNSQNAAGLAMVQALAGV